MGHTKIIKELVLTCPYVLLKNGHAVGKGCVHGCSMLGPAMVGSWSQSSWSGVVAKDVWRL